MLKIKEFMKNLREMQKDLTSLTEEREQLFARITSTTVSLKAVSVQSSGDGDKMAAITPIILELDEKIQDQIRKIVMAQMRADDIICKIQNPVHREILRWYYVQGLKWEDVAQRMNYDVSYVQRLNGQALLEAEKIFKNQ